MALTLSLLGETNLSLNGNPIDNLSAEKARALLYYLAVESDRACRREFLAEMFWPENPPGYGRNSLKQALSKLRKALGEKGSDGTFLISSMRDLQFNTGSNCWIDVLELERLVQSTKNHDHEVLDQCETCAESLRQAIALYRDEFLSDFYLPDSPDFNEWTLIRREYYRRLIADSLHTLVSFHEQRHEYKKAADHAGKLIELEPWNESSHRKLMALLATSGKRSAALKQYQTCKSMLANEFDAKPTQETFALYEKIKNWDFSTSHSPEVASHLISPGQPSPEGEHTALPQKSLRVWVRISAVFSILALTAILYLVFFHDSPRLDGPPLISGETSSTVEKMAQNPPSPTDDLGDAQTGGSVSNPTSSTAYLIDPGHTCPDGEKLLYLEDFQDGRAQGWPEIEFRAQDWDIVTAPDEPGNLVVQNPGKYEVGSYLDGYTFSDAVWRADFYISGMMEYVFIWRHTEDSFQSEYGIIHSSDYSMGFLFDGTYFHRSTEPLANVTLLAIPISISNEAWHTIEISSYRDVLEVWLDGAQLLSYQDPDPLPPGSLGLAIWDAKEEDSMIYFDNFRVCELTGPFVSMYSQ